MFGASNPFGQGSNSSSPFGSQTQSVFGQNNNSAASNNPFAPKPFGASSPFGAQSGGSMFGGTSTGVFGQPQASSPFGASSQGFGSSTPSFGAPSASAFGNSPSPFGGTSTFGQNGFSTPQSSPFGSTTQQSQPAFGNSTFGSSTPFGTSSTPAFGSTNTSAFGAPSTSAFGSTNTSAFGAPSTSAFGAPSTSAFGSTNTSAFGAPSTSAFGSTNTSAFGNSGSAFGNNAFGSGNAFGTPSTSGFGAPSTSGFGAPSTSAFGAPNNSAFGAPSTSAFGAPSTSAFGAPSTSGFGAPSTSGFGAPNNSAFGAPTTSAFGAPTTSAFGFGSSPAFGQSTQSPFGAQGAQASTSNFGNQQGGSRVTPYAATVDTDSGTGTPGKFQSISAMPVYKDKCHEELRWDDYQRGDKGGKLPPGQTSAFSQTPPNPFGQPSSNPSQAFQSTIAPNPSLFGQPSSNPTNTFQSSPNLFSQNTPATNTNFSSPFGQPTTPSLFATSSNTSSGFGQSSGFATTTTQPFGSSPSLFSSTPAQGSTPAFSNGNFNNSQSAPLFSSSPSFAQTNSGFGQTQPSIFSTPSTGFPNMSTSSPALNTSISPFGQTQPAGVTPNQPTQPSFNFNNSGQNQAGGLGFGQVNYGQVPAMANPIATQPIPVTNPFVTLPAVPQVSIGQGGYSPPIQYGISSMPVVDRAAPARVSPLISRHLLRRRVMPSVRKYRPVDDSPRVPFFSDEENSDTPKADASIIPRENPRALLILGLKKKIAAPLKDETTPLQENGKRSNGVLTNGANNENKKNGEVRDAPPVKAKEKLNVAHENHGGDKNGSKSSPSSAEIESVLPKLYNGEYFTEPRIHVLAAKERADPGYTGRVRDFVVGRHGFGSIKFLGESDLRKLNLEKLIQFNKREVLVYMDESQKPPVGEGLNKPAEVTLLNIKCMDKKSGQQVKEGPMVEKYLEMLKRKAEEQGAQFVSYDAVNGEWKFKVEHF